MPLVELLRKVGRVADPLSAKDVDCFPGGKAGEQFDVHPAMADRLVNSRPEDPAAKYTDAKPEAEGEGDMETTGPTEKPEKTTAKRPGKEKGKRGKG